MKIVKEFILREIAGECVLVPTGATSQEFNGMITISDTAKFIWSITRLYRIGHTEMEITAPLSMKSPRNLEKFRTGQAKRPDDEVIHYQVEMTENLDEIKEDLLGKKTGRVIFRDNLTVFQTSGGECRFINFLGMDWHYAVSSQEGMNQYHVWFVPEVA